jgi:hypothetical protein
MGVVAMVGGIALPAPSVAAAPALVQQEQPQTVHEIIFPDVPGGFNGMKVGYTITGAILGAPQDYGSSMRSYQGRLGAGTLTLSGWVEQTGGYGADVSVSVKVGDQEDSYDGGGGTPWRQAFSVSLPIPQGETKGSFSIWMTGSYNAGDRDIFINGKYIHRWTIPTATGASRQRYAPRARRRWPGLWSSWCGSRRRRASPSIAGLPARLPMRRGSICLPTCP